MKSQGRGHRSKCKSIAVLLAMWREDIGTATLNSHAVPAWLFLYTPPVDITHVGCITVFLKLACFVYLDVTMSHYCTKFANSRHFHTIIHVQSYTQIAKTDAYKTLCTTISAKKHVITRTGLFKKNKINHIHYKKVCEINNETN